MATIVGRKGRPYTALPPPSLLLPRPSDGAAHPSRGRVSPGRIPGRGKSRMAWGMPPDPLPLARSRGGPEGAIWDW